MEVEEEQRELETWKGYADWRNRAAVKGRHGGMIAASFVLVVEILENLAYLANASNLVMYMKEYMHLSPSRSANDVTNFMGTSFLLALLGGFFSDAFFSSSFIFLLSASIELLSTEFFVRLHLPENRKNLCECLFPSTPFIDSINQGLILLTVQARTPSLMPPSCQGTAEPCEPVGGLKAATLFVGLYLVALGVGGIKGSLPSHGAEQFDETAPKGRRQRSTFFNYFVFCLSCGALVAVTLVVWLEDNKGWEWGFGVSTISIFVSILVFLSGSRFYRNKIPFGSPLTTILKVLCAAAVNTCTSKSSSNAIVNLAVSPSNHCVSKGKDQSEEEIEKTNRHRHLEASPVLITNSLRCLNRAAEEKPVHTSLECTVEQVEDVKIVLKMLPIFACTIMLNCCLAQLSTFSVQQAATMNTKLGKLKVPPASLPVFPVVFIMILAPVYDHLIIPFARRVTKSEMGVTHLQRIGIGLVLSILAMAVAAVVEIKRKRVATDMGLLGSQETLPISFLWVAFQYLFLGSADLFTLAGLLEFFFTEAPSSMRSLATSLSWASLAMGYYLSSVVVSVVNSVSGRSRHEPWLEGESLNHYKLDRFYWLMCVLSAANFLHYLFWAMRYKYRSTGVIS
ncbi:PREDICTED: protein NRT1/ PTR FAMILY 4.6-like isoform X2 [Tarenaya hassleriana]|uniref:protein NRT1/ PTR FAMILY 4.6-like isoform X2 n=1 Tax=Tarenaya hassleriana TaxID=28532 RepID=UPI00053C9628|nr:PREDICTED: protein NRT1/ PTR FAMILY 4.6-like isoform X2 [Tarenaya hassleriana]